MTIVFLAWEVPKRLQISRCVSWASNLCDTWVQCALHRRYCMKLVRCRITTELTILTEMMADEFNFLRPEIKDYKAGADADVIPIPGQLELHGRCRCGVLLSTCFCALVAADLIGGMEELELHYRHRGRYNSRIIKIATISVRMVVS